MGRELFQVIRQRSFGNLTSTERNIVNLMNDIKVLEPKSPINPYDTSRYESQKEVYHNLMEAIQTINSKTITPKGVLYAEAINGKIIIGFAMCNYNYFDWTKENKEVLKEIAKGRARTWFPLLLKEVKIPQSIQMELFCFINRANKYFKNENLVDWAKEFVGEPGKEPTDEELKVKTMEFKLGYDKKNIDMVNEIFKSLFNMDVNLKFQDDVGC